MHIDVFSDPVCPWCFIGTRRLWRALDARPALKPTVRWRPFQLNPAMPQEGMERQSYLVSRRTREIGIRIALGAEGGTVVRDVVKAGLFMGGLGAILGVGAALGLVQLIQAALFGVAPTDPLVFSIVPGLLLAGCLVASLVPALRASGINPVEALANE